MKPISCKIHTKETTKIYLFYFYFNLIPCFFKFTSCKIKYTANVRNLFIHGASIIKKIQIFSTIIRRGSIDRMVMKHKNDALITALYR